MASRRSLHVSLLLVLLITFAAFFPSLFNELTNWDDTTYITHNHAIRDLSWGGVRHIFTDFKRDFYKPLTILSYAVEYRFFKLNPFPYHATNLGLHLFNCALTFWWVLLLCRLFPGSSRASDGPRPWSAFITAVFFGIHPMHVESVAWATERKDVLYTVFFLGALIAYTYFLTGKSRKLLYATFFLMLLSLLAKPVVAVVLPLVLLLLDYAARGKIQKENVSEKVPFFFLSVFFGLLTLYTQSQAGALTHSRYFTVIDPFFIAHFGVLFYLVKLFAPFNLSCIYPYPEKTGVFLPAVYLIAPVIVIAGFAFIFRAWRKQRKIIFGFLFFLVTLLPVIQLIPSGMAQVADRYTYVPYLGLFFLAGEGFSKLYERPGGSGRALKFLGLFVLGVLIAGSAYLTWQRCHVWKDSVTLWSDVIVKNPKVTMAYVNRGSAYGSRGERDKAKADYEAALRINPDYTEAYNNLGYEYSRRGDRERAIEHYNRAIILKPDFFEAYNNRGHEYSLAGEKEKAIKDFTTAIRLKGDFSPAFNNRGNQYMDRGEYAKALGEYNRAIELNPYFASAYNNRGNLHSAQGDHDKAIEDYKKAVELRPHFPKAYNNLGYHYAVKGELDVSIDYFEKALELNPEFKLARTNQLTVQALKKDSAPYSRRMEQGRATALDFYERANLFALRRFWGLAIEDYTQAIRLKPGFKEAYNDRGAVYHEKNDWEEAIRDYSEAIRLDPNFGYAYFNRALTLEIAGRPREALADYERFMALGGREREMASARGRIEALRTQ